jgi:hypothetical protein
MRAYRTSLRVRGHSLTLAHAILAYSDRCMKRLASGYWRWLRTGLNLTVGGRVAFTVVALIGLAAVVGDATTGGTDGPNAGGVLLVFVFMALVVVVAADGVFRLARLGLRSLRDSRGFE